MLPIALAAGLAGVATAGARLAGLIDLPVYVFALTLAAAVIASRGAIIPANNMPERKIR